jgi:fructoselysine-6-P-deglycase FrlB-like protein
MGRELAAGPDVVDRTLSGLEHADSGVMALLARAPRVVLLGTGASLAVCRAALPMLQIADRTAGRPLIALEASAVALGPGAVPWVSGDCVVAVSKSGTSLEVLGAARRAVADGACLIAVTGDRGSPLARVADEVVKIHLSEEHGAATQSALGAMAALLAMWQLVGRDARSRHDVADLLRSTVCEWEVARTLGVELARLHGIWILGFGSALGLAEAGALLWHEKVGRPAVSATPSAFRHGQIEAARTDDGVLSVEIEPGSPGQARYARLLAAECSAVGVHQFWLSNEPPPAGRWLSLQADHAPVRLLEALLRIQQLARATAHAAGSYRDGFAILGVLVDTTTPFD